MVVPILAIICAVGLPVLTVIILGVKHSDSKHKERMAMIEKGIVIEEPEKKINNYASLRNGCVMIGLSLGCLIGFFLRNQFTLRYGEDNFLAFVFTILGGGIGFIVYFFLARLLEKKEQKA